MENRLQACFFSVVVFVVEFVYFYLIAFFTYAIVLFMLFLCDFSAASFTRVGFLRFVHFTLGLQTCLLTLRLAGRPSIPNTCRHSFHNLPCLFRSRIFCSGILSCFWSLLALFLYLCYLLEDCFQVGLFLVYVAGFVVCFFDVVV